MTITSITIPDHSTRSSPSLHVVFRIVVVDDERGLYQIHRRFKTFVALDEGFRKSTEVPDPPRQLPARASFITNTLTKLHLDDHFLNERKAGLQDWLHGIVFSKFKRSWTDTPEWASFIDEGAEARQTQKLVTASTDVKGIPFKGANSYYLHTLNEPDRGEVLSALSGAGITHVRIFISHVAANNKGSNSIECPDLEPDAVGTYDDTVLGLIDQLMSEMSALNMKLIIACHDRYALGFWDTDTYATTFGVVAQGSSGAQQVSDASAFYNSTDASSSMDNRIKHILAHENTVMSNATWASNPGSVIYAIEAENEPFGHMNSIVNSAWIGDRSTTIKSNLGSSSGILVSNGGGVDVSTSVADSKFTDAGVDVVCVHDYGTTPFDTMPTVSTARGKALDQGKTLIFEEWGAVGSSKPDTINSYIEALYDYNIGYLVWEVVKPGAGQSDYEIWTDNTPAWDALTHTPTGD